MATIGRTQTHTYTGTAERVWDDGFELDTGDRRLRVDSWDLYGDNTPSRVNVGDRLRVAGEFDGGEFDATAIAIEAAATDSTTSEASTPAPPMADRTERGEGYTGTVVRVWDDGFELDTGDRRLRVDSWDLYGDNTPSRVNVGDRLRVAGEFDGGEFDATAIAPAEDP